MWVLGIKPRFSQEWPVTPTTEPPLQPRELSFLKSDLKDCFNKISLLPRLLLLAGHKTFILSCFFFLIPPRCVALEPKHLNRFCSMTAFTLSLRRELVGSLGTILDCPELYCESLSRKEGREAGSLCMLVNHHYQESVRQEL